MPFSEFKSVLEHSGMPVQVDGTFSWATGIPNVHTVMASGIWPSSTPYQSETISFSYSVGGIEYYRCDCSDPDDLNKDLYAVVVPPDQNDMLLIDGPKKDDEHWVDEVPQRYKGAPTINISQE